MIGIIPTIAVLALAIAAIAFLRRGKKKRDVSFSVPRVDGFQVTTPLHPRMTRGCVFDMGMQYGRGFRRRDGPALPHGPDCQCRTVAFSFSGNEVFAGALRKFGELACPTPGFPPDACRPLQEALRRMAADPVPASEADYLARAGLEAFRAEHREPVRRFFSERYAFLTERQAGLDPRAGGPEHPTGAA